MREIKFRAWNSCQMLTWEWLSAMGYVGMMLTGCKRFESIMQFTGLLDKNGREIYEGDILQYHSALVAKGSNPLIKQIVTWAQWHYEGIRNWKQSEVIGNIYENPKLLKEKTARLIISLRSSEDI